MSFMYTFPFLEIPTRSAFLSAGFAGFEIPLSKLLQTPAADTPSKFASSNRWSYALTLSSYALWGISFRLCFNRFLISENWTCCSVWNLLTPVSFLIFTCDIWWTSRCGILFFVNLPWSNGEVCGYTNYIGLNKWDYGFIYIWIMQKLKGKYIRIFLPFYFVI